MRLRGVGSGLAFLSLRQKWSQRRTPVSFAQLISALINWGSDAARRTYMRYDKARQGAGVLSRLARFHQIKVYVRSIVALVLIVAATGLMSRNASAEVSELRLARQYGLSHLATALMDHLQLVQHQAA